METLLSLLVLSFCVISVFIALYFRAVGQIAAHRGIYRDIEREYKSLESQYEEVSNYLNSALSYITELEDQADTHKWQLDSLSKDLQSQQTTMFWSGANALASLWGKQAKEYIYVTDKLELVDGNGHVVAQYNVRTQQFEFVKHNKNNNGTKIPVNSN